MYFHSQNTPQNVEYCVLFRGRSFENLSRLPGRGTGLDCNSFVENILQSQVEIFLFLVTYEAWTYTRRGKNDAIKGNTETFLGDVELSRLHCPHLSLRISTASFFFQVLFSTKL